MHIGYREIIRARVLKKHQFRGKTDWPVPAPVLLPATPTIQVSVVEVPLTNAVSPNNAMRSPTRRQRCQPTDRSWQSLVRL